MGGIITPSGRLRKDLPYGYNPWLAPTVSPPPTVSPAPEAPPPEARPLDDPAWRGWCASLAWAGPLAAAVLFAGNSMGYYDAPALAASAAGMGVTHPPGHPLWVALGAIASLVPVGTVALRLALLGGACLALTGRATFGLAHRFVTAILARGEVPAGAGRMTALVSLSAAWGATLGVAALRQATRAEVYALALCLAVGVLGVLFAPSLPRATRARLAVVLLGLAGCNHTFIALTAVPATLGLLWVELRGDLPRARRFALAALPLGALSLAPYLLLPLRSRSPASLVRVNTAGDFLWTVTARAFQKNVGGGGVGSFSEHLLACLDWAGRSLTPLGLAAAFAGIALGLWGPRGRTTARDMTVVLGGTVGLSFAARAALGFVADNPDAAGYLAPAIALLAVFAAALPVSVWRALAIAPAAPRGPSPIARALLLAILVVGPCLAPLLALTGTVWATESDRGHGPAVIVAATLDPAPPRAVLLAYGPDTVFRLRYAQLVEGERPDVTVVPVPLVAYPGMTNALLARDAALLPLVRDYLSRGSPRIETLLELASARPVRAEIDPHSVLEFTSLFVPRGATAEMRGEPTTLAAVRGTAPLHFNAVDALEQALAREPGGDTEARVAEYLLWRHYNDAIFFAARGARAEARASVQRALARSPRARELVGLRDALAIEAEGPLDVRPFLVGAPGRP